MDSNDSVVAPTEGETGQAVTTPDANGQVDAAPAPNDGQVTIPDGTTTPDSTGNVYNYESMTPEQVHKHWQGEYTRKSQEFADLQRQMDPLLEIQRNPLPAIQQYLQQYGYQISRPGANNPDTYGDEPAAQQPGVDPNMILSQVQQYVQQQLSPLQENLQQQSVNQVVQELNTNFPDWEQYEGPIKDNLVKYPNLAKNISAL